jgi:hypothetical protein
MSVSCGGSTRDDATELENSPSASDDTAAQCALLKSDAVQLLNDAVEAAPKACSADSECILFVGRSPGCVFRCGLEAAVTDAAGIESAMEVVRSDYCRDECRTEPPSCGGGYDVEPTARCIDGACTLIPGQ